MKLIMDNDIRQIAKYETKCTGCGACVNVCPVMAIKLVERDGLFLFPEIDESRCLKCGLCLDKCPAKTPRPEPSKIRDEVVYGCYVKDDEARARSASGGVFQALARAMLAKGGVVAGARFDAEYRVEHVIVEREEDLAPLICTKYVQSDPKNVYRDIIQYLRSGRKVLFVGTPCQVAALRMVVGNDADQLLTVDLLCAGVPPYGLLKNHLEAIAGCVGSVANLRFRDKTPTGWKEIRLSFDYSEGCHYTRSWRDDSYLRGFLEYLTIRRSCGKCRFARFPRQGDLSIGDLWTIAEQDFKWLDDRGVSAVIINTDKGAHAFKSIKNTFSKIRRVDLGRLSNTNNVQSHSYAHPNAHRFFAAIKQQGVRNTDALIDEYLGKNDGVCILNFSDAHANYGSVLTAYALQQKIKMLIGYEPVNVHLWRSEGGDSPIGDLIDFNRENIYSTKLIQSYSDLVNLNKHFRTFIVGPDTVWYNCRFTGDFYWFLFNFAKFSKNISSYAASFCFPYLINLDASRGIRSEVSQEDIDERKRLMKRFSHVSVREDSGATLCRTIFDVEAEHVLDAVFLLRAEDYNRLLLGEADASSKHRIATYILYPSKLSVGLREEIYSQKDILHLREGGDFDKDRHSQELKGVTIKEYLHGIRDCECFVTDSFHGLCFALIFRKQFILLRPSDSYVGSERLDSLIRILGIPRNRFVETIGEFLSALSSSVDYLDLDPRLNVWIAKSERYLERVLADNKPNKIRDWLESVEVSIEDLKKSMPRHLTVKQQVVRVVRGIALRALRLGVISYVITAQSRTLVVFHVPILRVRYTAAGKTISCLGIKFVRE